MGGHLLDLYRLARFDVRNPHSYSKVRQIKALAARTHSRTFIETGTFVGNTTMRCSNTFERVITMELDADLFRQARAYLASRPNVSCLHGDALQLLPTVLDSPEVVDALVFLDGHFSGGATAHGSLVEPACEEITVLAGHTHKINAVVVDDFRCFGRDAGWPKRSTLLQTIEDSFGDDFEFTVQFDQVLIWRTSPRAPLPGRRRNASPASTASS
jgi:hypothetical protein